MTTDYEKVKVSIALLVRDAMPYDRVALTNCVEAAVEQDHPEVEVLLIDDRGPTATPDLPSAGADQLKRLRHLPGRYRNRAAMYNAALKASTGAFLLLVGNDQAPVELRRAATRTMLLAATRRAGVGMVYADYELVDSAGGREEIHLLDWHEGRLRDTMDLGAVLLCPAAVLRELGGLNEDYSSAELYDLRLRIGEGHKLVHIANRYAGALYSVTAPARAHNVFDYLLADKQSQREAEKALTAHLKRTGAYLAPRAHVRAVDYDASALRRFEDCLVSVVIPVNNRPQFIGRAIESVQQQTVRKVEVIVVVNGGPADSTAAAVRRYMDGGPRYDSAAPPVRLLVLDVNNIGLCLNVGIAAARGKYYVQLDSDDRLKPFAVERILEVFDSDPTVGMVLGSYEVWNLDEETGALVRDRSIPVVTHGEWTADNGRNNVLRVNGAGAPRAAHIKAIAEAGWFGVNDDPCCRNYGEDYDLVLRISERHTIGRVWEPIYDVIRHSGGTDHSIDRATIDRNDNAKDHMRREALARRRRLNAKSGG